MQMKMESALDLHGDVTRAHSGDPEVFQSIFARYARPVLGFIYHLVGDRAHAEDLTQETFVRAYRKLSTVKEETRLSTWLFGIARNVVHEAIREKSRQRKIEMDEEAGVSIGTSTAGPYQQLVNGELQRAIRLALQTLPEDHRLVFVLKMFHNLSYDEIAQVTGSSVGKLKTDLHRARLEMRRRLQVWGATMEPRGEM
jgi:RNA polymerase sigma-70 factor (ECF subfamily)